MDSGVGPYPTRLRVRDAANGAASRGAGAPAAVAGKRALGDITGLAANSSNIGPHAAPAAAAKKPAIKPRATHIENQKPETKVAGGGVTKPTRRSTRISLQGGNNGEKENSDPSSRSLGVAKKRSTAPQPLATAQVPAQNNSKARKTQTASRKKAKNQSLGSTIDGFCGMGIENEHEPVIDIDANDVLDPLCANERRYLADIFDIHRQREVMFRPRENYMAAHDDVTEKMRSILVDWLVDVHQKFKLIPETIFLTVNIIDRFLGSQIIGRQKLQLVGVTAMLISSKYNEIYAPEISDFVYISDNAYTKSQILDMEALILEKLQFDITVPSSLTFVQRFLKASGSENKEVASWSSYMLELALQDIKMLRYVPSVISAAACYLAGQFTSAYGWHKTLQHYSKYSLDDIMECCNDLCNLCINEIKKAVDPVEKNRANKLTAIRRKYESPKYFEVSKNSIPLDIDPTKPLL